jgi:galactokinase
MDSVYFSSEHDLVVTRAPGRLDLMGGIADYSGSLVLQMPIAATTHVTLQRRDDRRIRLASLSVAFGKSARNFEMSLDDFLTPEGPISYETARALFKSQPDDQWAAYAAGAYLVLMREKGARFEEGANLLIRSEVPEGKGVSSSAALEVATMQALAAAYDIALQPREMAFLCQKVENLVAGAPCGVMDQMTSVLGEADRLLVLLCQPGEVQGTIALPAELAVWGIDSGVRHEVGGADYGTVRTAAFMGYRIIADLACLPCRVAAAAQRVQIEDERWHGYLANLTAAEFEQQFAPYLPRELTGAEFLQQYQGTTDSVTVVEPERTYPVYFATRHPIYENERVSLFAELLRHWQGDENASLLGELMYASHASYTACGLGAQRTDLLVQLVKEIGPAQGLYGAKITGGGSGGTVAVLGRREAEPLIQQVAAQYAKLTGHQPLILSGSAPGAAKFGQLKLKKEQL